MDGKKSSTRFMLPSSFVGNIHFLQLIALFLCYNTLSAVTIVDV